MDKTKYPAKIIKPVKEATQGVLNGYKIRFYAYSSIGTSTYFKDLSYFCRAVEYLVYVAP